MSAGLGSVNIRDDDAVVLIGVPVMALEGVDDNGDGLLQPEEIRRHHAAILRQINQGFTLTIDGRPAVAQEEHLLVSVHVDNDHSTPQIEWWSRLVFEPAGDAKPCVNLRLNWFLPNKGADEQLSYNVQVRRHADVEVAHLTKKQPAHRFHCKGHD